MATKITFIDAGEGLEQDKTNWKKVDALKEEEIDCNDIPDYGTEFWKAAVILHPSDK